MDPITPGSERPDRLEGQAFLLLQAGRRAEAKDLCVRALAVDDRHIRSLVTLGVIEVAEGRLPVALELFRKAIAHDATNYHAHLNAGGALLKLQRYPEAIKELTVAVGLAASPTIALIMRSRAHRRSGNPVQGAGDARAALKLNPSLRAARLELAKSLVASGREREALESLLQVPDLGKTGASEWLLKSRIEAGLGLFAAAIVSIDRAIGMEPNNTAFQTVRSRLLTIPHQAAAFPYVVPVSATAPASDFRKHSSP